MARRALAIFPLILLFVFGDASAKKDPVKKRDGPFADLLKIDDDSGEGDAGRKNEKNHALKHRKAPVKFYADDDDKEKEEEDDDEGVS